MAKRVTKVSEVVKELSESKFSEEFDEEVKKRGLSSFLFAIRCHNNLTQQQMADKIGCSQSKISKIESAYDSEISVKDLLDYSKALDLQLEIGFRNSNVKIVDLIKYHTTKIQHYLERLKEIGKKDQKIAEGINKFLLGFMQFVESCVTDVDSSQRKIGRNKSVNIHISTPLETKLPDNEAEKIG